ncbi:hypothetical protein YS110_06165 [Acidovorax sp. YS12]|nr:hypothetical protein YS110_06165 [Acidovorax sp. YS12]
MRLELTHEVRGLQIQVSGPQGGPPRSLFDFGTLGFHPRVASALIRGFIAMHGHNTIDSQRLAWRGIRCFALALAKKAAQQPLPANCIADLSVWLRRSQYGPKAAQECMNAICRLLRWCMRNVRGTVDPDASLLPAQFQRPAPRVRPAMDEGQLKEILRCCYADIESTEARLAKGKLMRSGVAESEADEPFVRVIRELLDIGYGDLPRQQAVLEARAGSRVLARARAVGGLESISSQLYPTIHDVFPFYLAILVQTSSNPQALRLLTRSCIEPHAIRADLERLVWAKPRAGREQSADFPVGREWSAPNLVRRLCALNQELVSSARPEEGSLVFISRGKAGCRAISWQSLHNYLAAFLQRHALAGFHLSDLRRAGAKLHHVAGGSIRAAKKRLNHAGVDTTQRYTSVVDLQAQHDQTILRFQGVLLRESQRSRGRGAHTAVTGDSPVGPAMETVFGFACKDPLAGLAAGSTRGRMCMQFYQCATCPGAIIPVDDAYVVARLLGAGEALHQARLRSIREGWAARFDAIYGPVKTIIEQEILPLVSSAVREKATLLVDVKRLPLIE